MLDIISTLFVAGACGGFPLGTMIISLFIEINNPFYYVIMPYFDIPLVKLVYMLTNSLIFQPFLVSNIVYTMMLYIFPIILSLLRIILTQFSLIYLLSSSLLSNQIYKNKNALNDCATAKNRVSLRTTLITYWQLQIISVLFNEIGSILHPILLMIGFISGVLSGAATILGKSSMTSDATYIYPMYPAFLLIVLTIMVNGMPALAIAFENSIILRCVWNQKMANGSQAEWQGKYVKRLFKSFREIRVEVGVMGFVDRSYILKYVDGMVSNIVSIILYVNV